MSFHGNFIIVAEIILFMLHTRNSSDCNFKKINYIMFIKRQESKEKLNDKRISNYLFEGSKDSGNIDRDGTLCECCLTRSNLCV